MNKDSHCASFHQTFSLHLLFMKLPHILSTRKFSVNN